MKSFNNLGHLPLGERKLPGTKMSEKEIKNRIHSSEFKTRVVLELIRGDVTLSEAVRRYDIKESQLSRWKKDFLERAPHLFDRKLVQTGFESRVNELESLFKEQSLELAILKKALNRSPSNKGEAE